MDVQYEQRAIEDRRAFALYYRYGNERRNNTGNRRLDTVKALQPYFSGKASQGYAGTSDRTDTILEDIADAFGVPPDSLEMVEHDDLVDSAEICQSCADRARRYEELEAELAESQQDAERQRKQVRDLLLSMNISRQ